MNKITPSLLLTTCLGLGAFCVWGCFVAADADDWPLFSALSISAAACGYMAGAVISWLRDDGSKA